MTKHTIREQLQMYGVQTLSNPDLLAYILGNRPSTQEAQMAASKLLETYDLSQLPSADWADFCHSAGLSKAQAQQLNAVCELARRLALASPEESVRIKSATDAVALLKPLMGNLDHEEMRVLLLDTKNRVVANILLYVGTVNSSQVRIAEFFKAAIVRKCPGILVAHNHPTGSAEPSAEDIDTTKQLVAAGSLLDIDVLDHIIIGNPRCTSMKQLLKW